MSWQEQLETIPFSITTGDGKVYKPLWKDGQGSRDYNASKFEYISRPGSFVDRRAPKGTNYPLLFWFQGADNLEQAAAFRSSADDKRAWIVQHPMYGQITGQLLNLSWNDQNYNVTEFTADFWETLTDNQPSTVTSAPDGALEQARQVKIYSSQDFASIARPLPADVTAMKGNVQKMNLSISKVLDKNTYAGYQELKNSAFHAIDNVADQPETAIGSVYDLLAMPASLETSVTSRLTIYGLLLGQVKEILGLNPSTSKKAYMEATGAAIIVGAAIAVVNPDAGDYLSRRSVQAAAVQLQTLYADYLDTLETLYPSADGYAPAHDTQTSLQTQVLNASAGLSTIAAGAKQERTVLLEKDSNPIIEAHKYMGLDDDDANLNQFCEINNIKNKQALLLKKGRAITYLV